MIYYYGKMFSSALKPYCELKRDLRSNSEYYFYKDTKICCKDSRTMGEFLPNLLVFLRENPDVADQHLSIEIVIYIHVDPEVVNELKPLLRNFNIKLCISIHSYHLISLLSDNYNEIITYARVTSFDTLMSNMILVNTMILTIGLYINDINLLYILRDLNIPVLNINADLGSKDIKMSNIIINRAAGSKIDIDNVPIFIENRHKKNSFVVENRILTINEKHPDREIIADLITDCTTIAEIVSRLSPKTRVKSAV
jgi:GTP:adenosylcobinamide-phosphate guanylyltransferase